MEEQASHHRNSQNRRTRQYTEYWLATMRPRYNIQQTAENQLFVTSSPVTRARYLLWQRLCDQGDFGKGSVTAGANADL